MTELDAQDIRRYPLVLKSQARMTKNLLKLGALGLMLPFFLPESAWLADSLVLQKLGILIPAAHKLAAIAQLPNVVYAYITIMLTVAFFYGIGEFIFLESRRESLQYSIAKNAPRGRWNLWLKAFFGILFSAGLIALLYIFPGQHTGDPHGSRGQLIVSLMVMTKPGLAIFGAIASAGLGVAWFAWCLVVYNFFAIPFFRSTNR